MKNSKPSKPIRYIVLDETINVDNFQEVAVRLEINENDIQTIFHDIRLEDFGLIYLFENVSTIPNSTKHLDYVSNIWVKRTFYDAVYKELLLCNGESVLDLMCAVLMIFRRMESYLKLLTSTTPITPEMEFSRFLQDIVRKSKNIPHVKYIEFTSGFMLKKYDHAEYILQKLKVIIEEHFLKTDFVTLMQHLLTKTTDSTDAVTPGDINKMRTVFRKFCLLKVMIVTRKFKADNNEKYILLNQLFAQIGLIDYFRMKLATNANRHRIAGKIRKQIEELKNVATVTEVIKE